MQSRKHCLLTLRGPVSVLNMKGCFAERGRQAYLCLLSVRGRIAAPGQSPQSRLRFASHWQPKGNLHPTHLQPSEKILVHILRRLLSGSARLTTGISPCGAILRRRPVRARCTSGTENSVVWGRICLVGVWGNPPETPMVPMRNSACASSLSAEIRSEILCSIGNAEGQYGSQQDKRPQCLLRRWRSGNRPYKSVLARGQSR